VDLQGTQEAILLTERAHWDDDWLTYVIGIPNGRVFFPSAKGFH
jgi:hypothetical protein